MFLDYVMNDLVGFSNLNFETRIGYIITFNYSVFLS